MIALERSRFGLAIEPVKSIEINHLFALSVAKGLVEGQVYVDDPEDPSTFYVLHSYGMSLLFGRCDNDNFNNRFCEYALKRARKKDRVEWMQAYPSSWDDVLLKLCDGKLSPIAEKADEVKADEIELNTRVNFKFNHEKFEVFRKLNSSEVLDIRRSGKEVYSEMKGSVVPAYFWDSPEEFFENGVGFSLYDHGKLACTAYSAFIHGNQLELGIETLPEARGKGFAQHTCAALIDYCLQNGYEPIWACRLDNIGSYKLAQKIGFEPTFRIPYYRLGK